MNNGQHCELLQLKLLPNVINKCHLKDKERLATESQSQNKGMPSFAVSLYLTEEHIFHMRVHENTTWAMIKTVTQAATVARI